MVVLAGRPGVDGLRRDLTRALAGAIGALAAMPDDELRRRQGDLERLQGALEILTGGPGTPGTGAPPPASRPAVLVVDPDRSRDWRSPAWQLVDRATDPLQALALAQELRPDAIIYRLPSYGFGDASAIADLAQVGIALRVIVLASDARDRQRLAVVRRPRITILPHDADTPILHGALGLPVAPAEPVDMAVAAPADQLTTREHEVLHLMAAGKANKQIAAALGVSLATAKYHVANILRKLDATNRTQALANAFERGLLLH